MVDGKLAHAPREAWITGIGIVSCLGEGLDAHWQGFAGNKRVIDTESFAPFIVHPLAPIDFDKQIPKKGDQRQMEPWQRIGTYAAGLALDSAGAKGNKELLGRMDMIVAAGGGERDEAVDSAILTALPKAEHPDRFLNERLTSDLRPTLFLAQLSNLLAGNISIVHGVTGSSRTFMGEELSGVEAVRIALARIAAGQSEIALVGGSYNGERSDVVMLFEFGGFCLEGEFRPVWEREPKGGFAVASLGAFLVIESRAHATARNAAPIARLTSVASGYSRRGNPGAIEAELARLWPRVAGPLRPGTAAVISGATGAAPATAEEKSFLATHPELPVRATGTLIGHGVEPQMVMNVALAAMAVNRGKLFPPSDRAGFERPMEGALTQAVVTGVGHWRGEGLALVEAVG
ncbi:MAG TPA: beta-ketoacyl-ACP synthase [Xanthobacteraceae bacterium]